MTHADFVATWESFGAQWLFGEGFPTGSPRAWFRLSERGGGVWWSDERIPPGMSRPYEPPKPKQEKKKQAPRTILSGDLQPKLLWPWESNERPVRWQANPAHLGLEPEPLLWWEAEEWPQAA